MRSALLSLTVCVAVALSPIAAHGTTGRSGGTLVTITWWGHDGTGSPVRRATLGCAPLGGTLPDPGAACRKLTALGGRSAFAPIPPGRACAEIYGGPAHAIVSGTVDGKRVWVQLQRRNGCEIERYTRLAFLLPRA